MWTFTVDFWGGGAMRTEPAKSADDLNDEARGRLERWLLSPELREHMQLAGDVRKPKRTGPYIAVSREAGAGGDTISRIVGQKLGWDVLDKELLDFMTQRYNMPRDMLDIVDETRANWFYDVIGTFIDARIVSHDKYVVHLQRILYLAALHGRVVFVGRNAQAILPRESGIAVRIVAPKEHRIQRVMKLREVDRREAAAIIHDIDTGRNDFCQRYFHHDLTNPLHFDLTINTERFGLEVAADLVIEVFRQVHGDPHRLTHKPERPV
jgi:cytidylate kinase